MGKLQERVNAFFYMLYHYADIIVNTEGGTHMLFINRRGSPWMNNFAAAERWLNQQENVQQNLDNIKRPNINWVFMKCEGENCLTFNVVAALAHCCPAAQAGAQVCGGNGSTGHLQ